MKNLNLNEWTYKGTPMVGLHTMARRFLGLLVVHVGRAVMFAGFLLGWGLEEAVDSWKAIR